MRKDELRKLRKLYATRPMIKKAGNTVEVDCHRYDFDQHRYVDTKKTKAEYRLFMRCQNLGLYMKIAIFSADSMKDGIRTPKYEVFINTKGKEYITRELDKEGREVRWLTAMIGNLNAVYSYDSEITGKDRKKANRTFISRDGANSIKRLLEREGIKADGLSPEEMVDKWQENIRKQRIEEKERKEQAPWDADMKLVPKEPDGFRAWMQTETVRDDYIIYEYKKGGAKTGFCRHCGKDVPLKKAPHHREHIKCPVCGRTSVLISAGKIRKVWSDNTYYGTILQKIKGGFVIRDFSIRCTIRTEDYQNPEYYMHEYQRTLVRDGRLDIYRYELYKNKYHRWCKSDAWNPWRYEHKKEVYQRNLAAVTREIDRRSGLSQVMRVGKEVPVAEYLYMEHLYPAIEKLAKAGMEKMALEYVDHPNKFHELVAKGETELHKMLRIDKSRLKRMREAGASRVALAWYQEEKREDTAWDDGMIRAYAAAGIEPDDLIFIHDRMSYAKIRNYLEKQAGIQGESMGQAVQTWKDYLNMAKKAKMDVRNEMIYRPKNLWDAHADAIEQIEAKGIEKIAKETRKRFPGVDGVCETLGKYEYEDGEYCIRVPSGIGDIVREGTILRHCIHTCDYYFDRIQNRESYLVFLRRKGSEKTPWYTIEVEPGGNIRQKRTVGDNQLKDLDAAIPFLKKWQREIRRRISEEEKALAEEADRKRRENYEQLRKNGNKIWHGRLQGKLLADVLEQDFMEAI